MCYCIRKGHTRKITNLFRKLELKLHIFQQYFTPPPHPWNKVRAKPPWVPSTPIILTHSTIPFSKCFQSYRYIKKYANSGSTAPRLLRLWVRIPPGAWMFAFYECCVFWRLLLACVQLLGLHKYADSGTQTNIVCFWRLLLAHGTRTNIFCFWRVLVACAHLPGLHKEICR
jgi:hypothetical protein